MKNWLFRAATHIPHRIWDRFGDEQCLLPYYHMVSDQPVPHVSPLYRFRSVSEFEADLDYFLLRRRALSLEEFVASVRADGTPPRNTFLLTFDDGFRQMHDIVMPILIRKGVPGVFFLNTATLGNRAMGHHQKISLVLDLRAVSGRAFPETKIRRVLAAAGIDARDTEAALQSIPWSGRARLDEIAKICEMNFPAYLSREEPYLTSAQVLTMLQQGMAIGAHSIDHPLYAEIPLGEQLHQTRRSMEILAAKFALKIRAFAFPHTDWGVRAEFFSTVFNEGTLDVSFGTSGPARDCIKLNFQRFSMERTPVPAKVIVARHRVRRLKQQAIGRGVLKRV